MTNQHIPPPMKGDKNVTIIIKMDEDGKIIDAKDGGADIKDANTGKSMADSGTRLLCPNICCWRRIGGNWYCHPSFC